MRLNIILLSKAERILALALFVAFCIMFVPAPDHAIRIHDNFDGNFSTRHVLVNSGKFFETNPSAIVPGIMNGLPRGVFPKFTEIVSLLMYFFGSLPGFAVNFLLVRILAFAGIVLFARDHISVKTHQHGIIYLTAAVFACLPFAPMHGLTVAGVPLVLWAFYNFSKRVNIFFSILVLILFALWSNFILVGVHLILCLGALSLYYSIKEKKIRWNLFLAVALLAVTYALSEYMLFYMHWFNKGYHSARADFDKFLGLNFKGVIGNSVKVFFSGDYSSANYFGFIFIPVFVYLGISYFSVQDSTASKGLLFLVLLTVFSFVISVLDWKSFSFFYEKLPFAKEFNFKRFTNLLPGFFFLAVLCGMVSLNYKNNWLRLASPLLLLILFVFVWRGNISFNNSAFDTTGIKIENGQKATFAQFFDCDMYKDVKKELAADTLNNIIHFGISPSPSKYAGLPVLDDYQGDYPEAYKAQFRKIIEGELNKSEALKSYFDNWGLRCYMQSASLFENRAETKWGFVYEKELAINTAQLKEMNCHYILSGLLIGNATHLNLRLQRVLVSPADFKTVFLYRII